MNKINDPTAAPKKQENPGVLYRIFEIISYPIAAVLGFWAANTTAHNAAYKQAKGLGAFDDILATSKSKSDIQELVTKQIKTAEYSRRWPISKAAYQEAGYKRMEELGLTNFISKWKYMSLEDKPKVVFNGLKTFGISVGALLTIANSKAIYNLLSKKLKEGEQERSS